MTDVQDKQSVGHDGVKYHQREPWDRHDSHLRAASQDSTAGRKLFEQADAFANGLLDLLRPGGTSLRQIVGYCGEIPRSAR